MLYILITIFFVQAIITLKLFLIISESAEIVKFLWLKVGVLISVSVVVFVLLATYLLQLDVRLLG